MPGCGTMAWGSDGKFRYWPQTRRLTPKNILRVMREAKKQFDSIKDQITPGPMLVLPRNIAKLITQNIPISLKTGGNNV